MRVVPLFQRSRLDWDAFTAAVDELHERRWVKIAWRRRPHTRRPPGMPERNTRADRITATRFARWRYIATWPDVW
jgi:hypothetical protein